MTYFGCYLDVGGLVTKFKVGWCVGNCSREWFTSQKSETGNQSLSAGTEAAIVEGIVLKLTSSRCYLDMGGLVTKLQLDWCSENCLQEWFTSRKSATGNLSLSAGTAIALIDGYHVKNDLFIVVFWRFILLLIYLLNASAKPTGRRAPAADKQPYSTDVLLWPGALPLVRWGQLF